MEQRAYGRVAARPSSWPLNCREPSFRAERPQCPMTLPFVRPVGRLIQKIGSASTTTQKGDAPTDRPTARTRTGSPVRDPLERLERALDRRRYRRHRLVPRLKALAGGKAGRARCDRCLVASGHLFFEQHLDRLGQVPARCLGGLQDIGCGGTKIRQLGSFRGLVWGDLLAVSGEFRGRLWGGFS
jgi:hypothetical protein